MSSTNGAEGMSAIGLSSSQADVLLFDPITSFRGTLRTSAQGASETNFRLAAAHCHASLARFARCHIYLAPLACRRSSFGKFKRLAWRTENNLE